MDLKNKVKQKVLPSEVQEVWEHWKNQGAELQIFSQWLELLGVPAQKYNELEYGEYHQKVINHIFRNIEIYGSFNAKTIKKGFYNSKDLMLAFIKEWFPSKLQTKHDLPAIEVIIRKEQYQN